MANFFFLIVTVIFTLAPVVAHAAGTGDFAGFVDIGGGRKMFLECRGEGSPTVIFLSGKGNRADIWSTPSPNKPGPTVLPEIAKLTHVCAYDRPRTIGALASEPSRSDPVPLPVTATAGTADLQALVTAVKVSALYVLVGHSMGGLIARLFASEHGNEVAGLVLVDALSEDLYNGLTKAQRAAFEKLNDNAENYDNAKTFAQIRAAPSVRPMPVIVLTAGQVPISAGDIASGKFPPDVTQTFVDALWRVQVAAQDKLAGLFSGDKHILVENSHHYIHVEQPQVVIDAIRDVVKAVRDGKSTLLP